MSEQGTHQTIDDVFCITKGKMKMKLTLQDLDTLHKSNSQNASIEVDYEYSICILTLKNRVSHQEYVQVYEHLADLIDDYQFKNLILNLKELKKASLSSRRYFVQHIVPYVYRKRKSVTLTLILPSNFYQKIMIEGMAYFVKKSGFQAQIRYFKSLQEAQPHLF